MPETAAFAPKTGPLTGHADVLAGEPTVDEVNTAKDVFSLSVKPSLSRVVTPVSPYALILTANVSDIMQSLRLGPVALEHAQADRVDLDLEHRLDARPLEAELETARAREQRDRPHGRI
jgi:hypothetical protein